MELCVMEWNYVYTNRINYVSDGIMFVKADATLEMEQRDFARAALEYVCLIQEVRRLSG